MRYSSVGATDRHTQALMDSYNEGLQAGRAEELAKKRESTKEHDAKIIKDARARWEAEKRREHQHLVDMVRELAENLGIETSTWADTEY